MTARRTSPSETVGGRGRATRSPGGRRQGEPTEIARQIEQRILDGVYLVGEKLPTELQLAAEFSVGRNTVREAISQLKSNGLVRSRQGQGLFVADMQTSYVFRLDAQEMTRQSEFAKLFEFRRTIEVGVAGLAAERHSPAQLRRIESALARLHPNEADRSRLADIDAEFHRAIAQATGNHLFVNFVRVLNFVISRNASFVRMRASNVETWTATVFAEHQLIYERIAARDAAGAREAMDAHLGAASGRSRIQQALPRKKTPRPGTA